MEFVIRSRDNANVKPTGQATETAVAVVLDGTEQRVNLRSGLSRKSHPTLLRLHRLVVMVTLQPSSV